MANKKKKNKTEKKKPQGRPSGYSQKIANAICDGITGGLSLRKVLEGDDMPSMSMVMRWLASENHKTFREQYARAREAQAEYYVDELLEYADARPTFNRYDDEGNIVATQVDNGAIQANKLSVDTRKWILSKLLPKKYGDHMDVSHDVGPGLAQLLDEMNQGEKKK